MTTPPPKEPDLLQESIEALAALESYVGACPESPYKNGKRPFYVTGSIETIEALKAAIQAEEKRLKSRRGGGK